MVEICLLCMNIYMCNVSSLTFQVVLLFFAVSLDNEKKARAVLTTSTLVKQDTSLIRMVKRQHCPFNTQ